MARPEGWRNEPARHALAAKGVKTQTCKPPKFHAVNLHVVHKIELAQPSNWPGTAYEVTDLATGKTVIVSLDYDFPSLAENFGWYPRSKELRLQIENGETTMDLINAATEWLDEHIGKKADDPGYFER